MVVAEDLAGVVLAAGRGSRLRPLTLERPKALCPVGPDLLVDWALDRLERSGTVAVAVNAHHGADALVAHVGGSARWSGRVHLSVEAPVALGTAGALHHLSDWLDGRPALVVNADAWTTADPAVLVAAWNGHSPAVLVAGDEFGPSAAVAAAVVPADLIAQLPEGPSGLWQQVWERQHAEGNLQVVSTDATFIDCGTPARYLYANMVASGGSTVIGDGARMDGVAHRSVIWPGAVVSTGEVLVDAIRTGGGRTVLVR